MNRYQAPPEENSPPFAVPVPVSFSVSSTTFSIVGGSNWPPCTMPHV